MPPRQTWYVLLLASTHLPSSRLLPETGPRLRDFGRRPIDQAAPTRHYLVFFPFTAIVNAGRRICDMEMVISQGCF